MRPEILAESIMIGIVVTSISLVIGNLFYQCMKKVGG
jgi:hypothetical protein